MSKHITAKKDKVPLFEKLMYGAGSGSYQLASDGVKGLANPIFNITLGMNPSSIGLVLMISRIFDAFTDPLIGKISDDTRSRFGRRRPYIFIGSFLTAIAFCIIWMVPSTWSEHGIFVWYLCAMLLFYFCATIQTVPYHTLGLEMSPDYHERTVVSGYKMFFSFIFTLFLPWIFRLAQSDIFDGVMSGMRFISWYVAAGIIAGGVLPAIFVKERYFHIAAKNLKIPFLKGILLTFKNNAFIILTAIILTTGIGSGMVNALGNYIIFYYVKGGDLKEGASLAALGANAFSLGAIFSLPILTWFCGRIGKVKTMKIIVAIGIVGALSKLILYNKDYPYLILLNQLMLAPLAAGFWTITNSMKADICDDDELRNGMRREGMFGSIGGWITKLTMSTVFLLAGVILESTGFDVKHGANQSEETLSSMRILFAVVPAISSSIALLLLHAYPLNEKRMEEIRTELESRRNTVN